MTKASSTNVDFMGLRGFGSSTYNSPNAYFEGAPDRVGYAQTRYVTSSGEVYWIFILRDKETKNIISAYQAPDHPCFGNGGKPLLMHHPFPNYDPMKHEIIVINPTEEEVFDINKSCIMPDDKADKDFLEVFFEDYEIDEELQTEWPQKEVTVGLPKDFDWRNPHEKSMVTPIKRRIPKPEYITTRKCWKKRKTIIK